MLCWDGSLPSRGPRDDLDVMWDRVRLEPRKDEVVWLSNGDQLSGDFLGYDRVLKLLSDGKPRRSTQSRIVAVGFDPTHVNILGRSRDSWSSCFTTARGSVRLMPGSTKATWRRRRGSAEGAVSAGRS